MIKNRASGSINTAISPESIPITIPSAALQAIGDGYEFVEVLDFPQSGSGGTYHSGVFEDVLNSLKQRPIPGDKRGHQENPNDDFFVIGGKINKNQIQFRVRVPDTDYAGQYNDGFIRSLKTGNQKLSLVLDVEEDGSGEFNRLHSDSGLRNDAVGTLPAMRDQSIHANKAFESTDIRPADWLAEVLKVRFIIGDPIGTSLLYAAALPSNPLEGQVYTTGDGVYRQWKDGAWKTCRLTLDDQVIDSFRGGDIWERAKRAITLLLTRIDPMNYVTSAGAGAQTTAFPSLADVLAFYRAKQDMIEAQRIAAVESNRVCVKRYPVGGVYE